MKILCLKCLFFHVEGEKCLGIVGLLQDDAQDEDQEEN